MSEKEYLEKDVFSEHSRFMERFLAKMDEDRRDAREERRLAEIRLEREQERLKEERKEAEARLLAEERRLSEERNLAEERLKEERKAAEARLEKADERIAAERRTSITMYITLIVSVGIGFLAIFLALVMH